MDGKRSLKWAGQVTWNIQILVGTDHISKTAEARVVKFCTHVGYVKSQFKDYKSPLKGRGQNHVTHLKFWCPQWYLRNGWSLSRQILHAGRLYLMLAYSEKSPLKGGTEEYECVRYLLLPKWMCSESRYLCKYWEMW